MLELLRLAEEARATFRSVCFSPKYGPKNTNIRATITIEVKSVKYLVFGEGSTMEGALEAATANFASGDWRVAKFQD